MKTFLEPSGRARLSSARRWDVRTVRRRPEDRRALPIAVHGFINRCESSCRNRWRKKRVRLPRPVRHERGEGRGEGCFTLASGPTLRSASSPRPSPPFRTEERETETPVRTARTSAKTDNTRLASQDGGLRLPTYGFARVPQASRPESVRAARRRPNSQARTPAVPARSAPLAAVNVWRRIGRRSQFVRVLTSAATRLTALPPDRHATRTPRP